MATTKIQRPTSRQHKPSMIEPVFIGKLFNVWQWDQEQFDGSSKKFESLSRPDTVLILPVLSNGNVIFASEQQPGMKRMLRTLGGRIEKGEDAEEAARRELREETGFEATELRLWDAWQPINKIDWAVYLFVAHGLKTTDQQTLEAGEDIDLVEFSKTDLLDPTIPMMLDDNEFLFKLYFARGDAKEKTRIEHLLTFNHEP